MMTKIAITGAAGRMGRRIAALALDEPGRFEVVSGVEIPAHEAVGADVGVLAGASACGVAVGEDLHGAPDVLIDFSTPEATVAWLGRARERKIPMVIGTTGLTESQRAAIADAAGRIAIIQAPNFSVGVNLLFKIAGEVAAALGDGYDIEIVEAHHRFKADAPSGTALGLARSICEATGRDPADGLVHGRHGAASRRAGEIGMHAIRLGDTVGEHRVHFGCLGETVTLSHSAHTRDTFVRGALRAAEWIVRQPAGLYSMRNVLFA